MGEVPIGTHCLRGDGGGGKMDTAKSIYSNLKQAAVMQILHERILRYIAQALSIEPKESQTWISTHLSHIL